ncbi:type II toxin-antitoxin system VapB family antitoxin [Alcanivorax jadensis]|uniref:type II toxin-antitoxin system VapB family antitoxin n=1 Tax=Alcanivorax jadensis TaxID=64988 RepID=UPI00240A781B|nr:type II toxin-antitoxin system VapB family antitoxin [Alcanivorax jadensis]MDF1637842.1 type II toxin-antitoxin system VapB family antitoxin [Alcanivorax jadensis]
MRITLTIDDELYQQALATGGPDVGKADLFREAMRTYVRVQAAKRLASLGGAAPDMRDIPRHGGSDDL